MLNSRLVLTTCIFANLISVAVTAAEIPYSDDHAITRVLADLDDRSSALLPSVIVNAGDLKIHGMDNYGPGQRDYCNKMAYAASRQTALYAGGNHQVPHRMNDVWEYHLGSNTWHLLYAPDGGNPGKHKAAYFLTSRTLVRDPDKKLSEKEIAQIEAYRKWWNENVVFRDGHLTTKRGGPIMPAHTWDAFCYDDRAGKLIWGMGVSPAAQLSTHAYFTGKPLAALQEQADSTYSPLWMFDPAKRRWIHYRTARPRAKLRGMGATMAWLPDLGKSVWYVAAQNVSPGAFEMWLFDAAADEWTELKPNEAKPIGTLATKDGVAPMSEQQTAYSPKHKKLVAVLKHDTFVYDVAASQWCKAATDSRIYAHDARSVFGYDKMSDTFLLAFLPGGRGKKLKLASFSLATNRWDLIEPAGPGVPEIKYGGYMGYYDPRHNVFVVQGRYSDRIWVYRHRK
jgi:hypothetical protein